MNLDPNLNKWIIASINTYVKGIIPDSGEYPFAMYLQTDEQKPAINHVEVMINGPEVDLPSPNFVQVNLSLDLLVQVAVPLTGDIYQMQRILGILNKALQIGYIPINKLGTDEQDDQSFVFCLDLKGKVKTTPWGLFNAEVRVEQSTITANYFAVYQNP